jgi:glycosyltransferase involved in cell wall biosynthesis
MTIGDGVTVLPVSVVIPARNEEATLGALLASLNGQAAAPAEVVIVDAGSTDGTVGVARAHASSFATVVVEAGAATPGRARNVGVAAATQDWVAFIDAGTVVSPQWLHELWAVQLRDGAQVVSGSCEVAPRSWFEEGAVIAHLPAKARVEGGLARFPSVPGSLVHRSAWEAAGGFPDLRAGEDLVFLERLGALGATTAVAPSATYSWSFVATAGEAFRRYRLYSKHNVFAGRQATWHHGVARFYACCLPFVVLAAVHRRAWGLVPVLGLSARAANRLRRQGTERPVSWMLNPRRFAAVLEATVVVDAATFAGWIDARRSTGSEPS